LTAVTQIHEYFSVGRCSELTGHAGAYNLYESELRQNIIISNVEQINNKMNELARNQHNLYSMIQNTNRVLADVRTETGFIAHNTSVIALNTALWGAYYY